MRTFARQTHIANQRQNDSTSLCHSARARGPLTSKLPVALTGISNNHHLSSDHLASLQAQAVSISTPPRFFDDTHASSHAKLEIPFLPLPRLPFPLPPPLHRLLHHSCRSWWAKFKASTSKGLFPKRVTTVNLKVVTESKNPAYERSLVPRTEDWGLWRIKCKPSQEYFLLYELMMKHRDLKSELRSNRAEVAEGGLRAFSDTRMSSLGMVPEMDIGNQMGLYKGDIGLIRDVYHGAGSSRGVKVWVIPRLGLTDEDPPSSSPTKRKRRNHRPPLKLFDRRIMHSAQWFLKVFNPSSVSPAREMSTDVFALFMEAQRLLVNAFFLKKRLCLYPRVGALSWENPSSFMIKTATHAKERQTFNTGIHVHRNALDQCRGDITLSSIQWSVRTREECQGEYPKIPPVSLSSFRTGQTINVGYNDVRERWSGKVLASYQPLQPHQQQYSVEAPWKDVLVRVISGYYRDRQGLIKNVRRDFLGSLRLSLYLIRETLSNRPLMEYCPLGNDQLQEFGVNPSIQAMRTGPVPWVGLMVDFVIGSYKSEHGVVRGVDRYSTTTDSESGLTLTVERYTFTALGSN
ncbi:hypothetical protein BT96DRAFT_988488 [Gymnopus androsaceus JB14]|uniref:Uncharacterized protein n=1 Tax=Gymnopus androsaceus JB14 TaxID=1447944 RepID=A0A6A4I4P2_9AGAR|nr:hypothetical protein BT96DRAFT_988488 [Gymnopus androsaceus JB14]